MFFEEKTVPAARKITSLINQLNTAIARFENWLLVLIVMIMVIFSFFQVVMRNVFSEGILAGDIILRHLVLWVGFIGASLATRDERHITIDVFSRFLKGRIKLIAAIIVNFFSLLVGYFLTVAAIHFVQMEKEFGTALFSSVPSWYFQVIIPIGFALITMRFLLISIEKVRQFVLRDEAN